jgi:hypothetical protein
MALMKRVTTIGLPLYTLSKYRGIGLALKTFRDAGIIETLEKIAEIVVDEVDVPLSKIEMDTAP